MDSDVKYVCMCVCVLLPPAWSFLFLILDSLTSTARTDCVSMCLGNYYPFWCSGLEQLCNAMGCESRHQGGI